MVYFSLKSRLVITIASLALISAFIVNWVSSDLSRKQIERDQGVTLKHIAMNMASRLSQDISTRANEIAFLTNLKLIKDPSISYDDKKALFEQMKSSHPFYAWIGMTDAQGNILTGTDNLLVGKNVSKREWFTKGSQGLHFGDAHDAFLLAKIMPKPKWDDLPLRLVDISAPITDQQGNLLGVICGHLSLDWAFEARSKMLHQLDGEGIDLIVLNELGKVLMGTPDLPSLQVDLSHLLSFSSKDNQSAKPMVERWSDGEDYLTAVVTEHGFRNYPGMGWSVVARKPAKNAFLAATTLTHTTLLIGVVSIIFFCSVLWLFVARSLKPLEEVAQAAERIKNQDLTTSIPDLSGQSEIAIFARSLTDLVHTLQSRNEELRLAERIFTESGQGIMVTDTSKHIVKVNRAFIQISGYEAEEVIGKKPSILSSGRHEKTFYKTMNDNIMRYGFWRGEIWNKHKNGNIYPEWLTINTLRNNQGDISYYIGMFDDITEQKDYEDRLVHLANYDALTNLPNRHMLQSQLSQAIEATEQNLCLLFIDLDLFKNINDTLGHPAGDRVLIEVANRFKAQVGGHQTLARWGGDEFVVIAPNCDNIEAANLAEKLISTTQEPYFIEGQKYHLGLSCGISLFPTDGFDTASLLSCADIAMFEAKKDGSNRYKFYTSSMNDKVQHFIKYDAALRNSVENNLSDFALFYQPQFDPSGSYVVGVEALLRWQHKELGSVSPVEFIPLAEQTGLIHPIGRWVIDAACKAYVLMNERRAKPITMSINVSALQLHDHQLCEYLCQRTNEYGIPHASIIVEVTESAILSDEDRTTNTLKQLKTEGFPIAIDDFGTGYASLQYIQKLKPNEIKIDRSFISNMLEDQDSLNIVRFTLGLADTMHIRVVAEGVETVAQLTELQKMGHAHIQGFLLSKPVPFTELMQKITLGAERYQHAPTLL